MTDTDTYSTVLPVDAPSVSEKGNDTVSLRFDTGSSAPNSLPASPDASSLPSSVSSPSTPPGKQPDRSQAPDLSAVRSLDVHPVQTPAVAVPLLPLQAESSSLPAVYSSADVPAVLPPPRLDEAAPLFREEESSSRRRRSRRNPRGRKRVAEETEMISAAETPPGELSPSPEAVSLSDADSVARAAPVAVQEKSRSRRRRKTQKPVLEATPVPSPDRVEVQNDTLESSLAVIASESAAEVTVSEPPVQEQSPRKSRSRSRNRKTKPAQEPGTELSRTEEPADVPQKISKTGRAKASKAEPEIDRKMLVSVLPGDQVEVALLENGTVQEYYVEMTHQAKIRGNIYKGIINNVDANLQAAFVNFGAMKNGFLQIDEVHPEYYLHPHDPTKGHKYPPIQKVLKPGQEVLVQVVKEPTGNKGAFLTTWVSLAGRFLVLTPGQEQIGISRKVEDGEERSRLRELIKGLNPGEGLGAIVRTVSVGTSKTTLQKDLNFLKRVWKDIRKRATTEKAPALIYQEPGLASRCVRDYLSDDITAVWVDDEETAESIRGMAALLFPRKGELVHLYEDTQETLWERFHILRQLEQVHSREVSMPSGGRLVFDQTEALMAIDINSGRIGGKNNFEAMAHRTNMEAAVAIAQQLRLRDIGGQIVIDFIEMRDPEHGREVEKALRNAMKNDRARHDIGKMSAFGLLQIVRQRTGSSAISISMEPCPCCKGTGQRRNLEWQAVQTLRELHRAMRSAAAAGLANYAHQVDTDLGLYLLNHKRERLSTLEKDFHVRLEIRLNTLNPSTQAIASNGQTGHGEKGGGNGKQP